MSQKQFLGAKMREKEGSNPCAGYVQRVRAEQEAPHVAHDAVAMVVEEYARHTDSLLQPDASEMAREYAYGRLLGTRGSLCRLCPASEIPALPRRTRDQWAFAEARLREAFADPAQIEALSNLARRVEDGWADSIERYVVTLAARLHDTDIADQMGILKGIDTVGLHLAQREIFQLSDALTVPLENAQAVKLRVRLLALYLTLHRCGFCAAFPAIQSYRRTFRIYDPLAYPWWFVDCRLTEKQLNWTFKRLPMAEMGWRF